MKFDTSDVISMSTPARKRTNMKLCVSCMCVLPGGNMSCPTCDATNLLPYLDQRPLLLCRETRTKILGLVDDGVSMLSENGLSDTQDFLVNDYLPFLSDTLSASESAERSAALGNHSLYRKTDWDPDRIIASLYNLSLPPTGAL